MRDNISKEINLVFDNPVDTQIDFSLSKNIKINSHEIKKSVLTGNYRNDHQIKPANVVLSRVFEFFSENGKLDYVDFKDSFITKSSFKNTTFDFGAIINCQFENVIFENCTFYNVSITGTDFSSVTFINCKLDNMVIESCRFNKCSFENCSTSNKLFEFCLFIETYFKSTDIQLQSLTACFGLIANHFENRRIRNQSTKFDFKYLSDDEIKSTENLTELERFKITYFFEPECISQGHIDFEKTFELDSWLKTAQIQLTFTNLLSLYQEFLFDLYERELCSIFPLIKLHTLTDTLSKNESIDKNSLKIIYGIHMALALIVEDFLNCVSQVISTIKNPVVFLVNGPMDKGYYLKELSFALDNPELQITKIIKHNSPNELFVSWQSIQGIIPMIAVLMASRFKFEITKISTETASSSQKELLLTNKENLTNDKAFQLQLGFDDQQQYLYGLKLKSIFPGDMIIELGLQISLKKIDSVRKIIIKILGSSESE